MTEGKAEVESKKGNTISKNASEDDPAIVIERSGVSWFSPRSSLEQALVGRVKLPPRLGHLE